MRADVTTEEIAHYRENGFVVLPGFLDANELDAWREAVDGAVAERTTRTPNGSAAWLEDTSLMSKMFVQRMNLWVTDERVRPLVLDERIGKVLAELAGVDGIRVWHDQALIKDPYAPPTLWHLDAPAWSFTSPDAISIWIALDDATLSNGALCYLPGTHKKQAWEYSPGTGTIDSIFEFHPDWRDIEPVFCPVPAGTAICHNGLVCHGAGANMTPHPRRAMTIQAMPDGSTFNGKQNIIPDAVIDRFTVGDVLDDDNMNPLLYRRQAAPAGTR